MLIIIIIGLFIFIWGFLKDYIFWLVLKFEISYNRVIIIISWRILGFFFFFKEDFFWEDYIFAWWNRYLSFHNSSYFCLKIIIFFNVKMARPHPLFCICIMGFRLNPQIHHKLKVILEIFPLSLGPSLMVWSLPCFIPNLSCRWSYFGYTCCLNPKLELNLPACLPAGEPTL